MSRVIPSPPLTQLDLRAGLQYLHRRKTALDLLIHSLERYRSFQKAKHTRRSRHDKS